MDFQALWQIETIYLRTIVRFLVGLCVYLGSLVCLLKEDRMLVITFSDFEIYYMLYLPPFSQAKNLNTIFMSLFILDQQSFQWKMTAHLE